MKPIIYILCLFYSLQTFCQEKWQNKINSFRPDYNVVLQKADSNGWFVITNTKSFTFGETKSEVVLIRYDQCGKIRWSYKYGVDTASITMADALTDNGGNIVMTGYYSPPGDFVYNAKSFMMKVSSNGDLIWIRVFNLWGVEYVYSTGQTSDGGYFIFSNHDNVGGALPYNAVTKVNSNGNLVWYKHLADNPIWGSAIKTSDGGILIRSGNLIYKLSANGNVLWSNTYSDIRYTCKPVDINGQYIFASYPSSADSICYLFSLSSSGNLNWISPSFKSSSVASIKRLSNGNLLTTGNIRLSPSSNAKKCFTEFTIGGVIIQQQTINESHQQSTVLNSDFIELDNQSLIYSAIERIDANNDSLMLIKSSKLTDFSCSQINTLNPLQQQQITITPISFSPIDILNGEYIPVITKNSLTTTMDLYCFIPDTNHINLGNDTTLCPGKLLDLKAGLGNSYQYLWSTGAITPSIVVNQPGTYWVKAFNCDTISDTIIVKYFTPLTLDYKISPLYTNPYTLVKFENFTHPYSQLTWLTDDGNTYYTDFFNHLYKDGGIYYPILIITDNYGCVYSSKTKVIVEEVTFYIPNSFSPNGDGSNDEFIPKFTGVERYELFIYSRWGEEIFHTVNHGWDGKINGNVETMQGVFNYKFLIKDIFGKESIRSGSVTLFR